MRGRVRVVRVPWIYELDGATRRGEETEVPGIHSTATRQQHATATRQQHAIATRHSNTQHISILYTIVNKQHITTNIYTEQLTYSTATHRSLSRHLYIHIHSRSIRRVMFRCICNIHVPLIFCRNHTQQRTL